MSASLSAPAPAIDPPPAEDVVSEADTGANSEPEDPPAPPAWAKVQWSAPLIEAVRATGNGVALQAFLPLIESLLGASGVITPAMFTSREVKVDGVVRIVRQTSGSDRVLAMSSFTDQLMAAAPGDLGTKLDRGLLFSLLDSLLEFMAPEKAHSAVAGSPARSAGVARSLAATMVQEVHSETRRQREMPVGELNDRMALLEPVMGIGAPCASELGHRQQLKYLVDELETNKAIPRNLSTQPLKMCDLSDLSKKPGKEEDVEALTTSCLLVGRSRVRRYVYSCMVASANMAECKEICRALLSFDKAVQAASNITTLQQLQEAVDGAMQCAMNARDGECETKKSIAESYQAAARAIMNRNAAIGVMLSMGGTPTKKRGRDGDPRASPKTEWKIKVGENEYKKFKILAGGNPDCPINCTRPSCKKGSKCAFSHKNMA